MDNVRNNINRSERGNKASGGVVQEKNKKWLQLTVQGGGGDQSALPQVPRRLRTLVWE